MSEPANVKVCQHIANFIDSWVRVAQEAATSSDAELWELLQLVMQIWVSKHHVSEPIKQSSIITASSGITTVAKDHYHEAHLIEVESTRRSNENWRSDKHDLAQLHVLATEIEQRLEKLRHPAEHLAWLLLSRCHGFRLLAGCMLAVFGGQVRARMPKSRVLLDAFFLAAPRPWTLVAMVTHLGQVQPRGGASTSNSIMQVAEVGSDYAASFLHKHFAQHSSRGVLEVASYAATAQGASQTDEAAAALASLPDRAVVTQEASLLAPSFVPHAVRSLAHAIAAASSAVHLEAGSVQQSSDDRSPMIGLDSETTADTSQSGHANSNGINTDSCTTSCKQEDVVQQTAAFGGAVVGRLCRRGHTALVASSIWQLLNPMSDSEQTGQPVGLKSAADACDGASKSATAARLLLMAVHDRAAMEKLLEALLRHLCAPGWPLISEPMELPVLGTARTDDATAQATSKPSPFKFPASSRTPRKAHKPTSVPRGDVRNTESLESASVDSIRGVSKEESGNGSEISRAKTLPRLPDIGSYGAGASALAKAINDELWSRPAVRALLSERLLLQRMLPAQAAHFLLVLLAELPAAGPVNGSASQLQQVSETESQTPKALVSAALRIAQLWSADVTLTQAPPQAQAYLTEVLGAALVTLGRRQIEKVQGLLPAVLHGVSARLSSPDHIVRRQGMRLGSLFSRVLEPAKPPLFGQGDGIPRGDGTKAPFDLKLLPTEMWDPGTDVNLKSSEAVSKLPPKHEKQTSAAQPAVAAIAARRAARRESSVDPAGDPDTETDSDDEDLVPYDSCEEEEEQVKEETGAPFQLRDIAAALRKSDDVSAVLKALSDAGPLIAAAPDELPEYAAEVGRALLYSRVPEWADVEPGDVRPSDQRLGSLVALLVAAPTHAAAALLPDFSGPHLDTGQRLLLLDAMGAAAETLATGGLPALKAGQALPALHEAASEQRALQNLSASFPAVSTVSTGGQLGSGVSRRWGTKLRGTSGAVPLRRFHNQFAPVAKQWLVGLLADVTIPRQGVDLMGRDSFLLGKLLVTCGRFAAAVGNAATASEVTDVVSALLLMPQVGHHAEPFVRRSALFAATQVLTAVAAPRVAGALAAAAAGDAEEAGLVNRLDQIRLWTESLAANDPDEQCRRLATAARSVQARLGMGAMAALDKESYQLPDRLSVPAAGGLLGGLLSATHSLGNSGSGRVNVLTKYPVD